MPLFKRRPVAPPAGQAGGYHTGPSPMTRLKRMFSPRRTRHTHPTQSGAAAANPVAVVEREGRRAKRFFRRRTPGATTTAQPRRRRRGLFSSRRHDAGVAVPVRGTGAGVGRRRSPFASLAALFSRNRGPRHYQHAGGAGVGTGGGAHYVA